MNYRGHPKEAEDVAGRIKGAEGKAVTVRADVTKPEDVRALIQQAVGEFGRLDVMVNNVGVERKMPFLKTPLAVWNEVIAVNLTRSPKSSGSGRVPGLRCLRLRTFFIDGGMIRHAGSL